MRRSRKTMSAQRIVSPPCSKRCACVFLSPKCQASFEGKYLCVWLWCEWCLSTLRMLAGFHMSLSGDLCFCFSLARKFWRSYMCWQKEKTHALQGRVQFLSTRWTQKDGLKRTTRRGARKHTRTFFVFAFEVDMETTMPRTSCFISQNTILIAFFARIRYSLCYARSMTLEKWYALKNLPACHQSSRAPCACFFGRFWIFFVYPAQTLSTRGFFVDRMLACDWVKRRPRL